MINSFYRSVSFLWVLMLLCLSIQHEGKLLSNPPASVAQSLAVEANKQYELSMAIAKECNHRGDIQCAYNNYLV